MIVSLSQNLIILSVSIKEGQRTVVRQVEGGEWVSRMESLRYMGIFRMKSGR